MKILIFIIIGILITNFAFAITKGQLEQAEETLRAMDTKISILRGYVQTALSGKIGFIDLTPEQINQLKNKYIQEKMDLKILYQNLP